MSTNYGWSVHAGDGTNSRVDGPIPASFSEPLNLAVDGFGTIFVQEVQNNSAIRSIKNGVVSTVLDGASHIDIGIPAFGAGKLRVFHRNRVYRLSDSSGPTWVVPTFTNNSPIIEGGFCVDSQGYLYVASAYDNSSTFIYRSTDDGATFSPWIGTGVQATVDGDHGVAAVSYINGLVAGEGNWIWFIDNEQHLRRFHRVTRQVETIHSDTVNWLNSCGWHEGSSRPMVIAYNNELRLVNDNGTYDVITIPHYSHGVQIISIDDNVYFTQVGALTHNHTIWQYVPPPCNPLLAIARDADGLAIFDPSNTHDIKRLYSNQDGTRAVEFLNSVTLVTLGTVPNPVNTWQTIPVLRVLDLTDPQSPQEVSRFSAADVPGFNPEDWIHEFNPSSITLDGDKAYVTMNYDWNGGGFFIFDLSNPHNITLLGKFVIRTPDTRVQMIVDLVKVGADRLIGVAGHIGCVLTSFDISDIANPTLTHSQFFHWNGTSTPATPSLNIQNPGMDIVKLIKVSDTLIAGASWDYGGGLVLLDVSNPTNFVKYPVFPTGLPESGKAEDLSLRSDGRIAVADPGGYYNIQGGLVTVDVSDPTQPQQVWRRRGDIVGPPTRLALGWDDHSFIGSYMTNVGGLVVYDKAGTVVGSSSDAAIYNVWDIAVNKCEFTSTPSFVDVSGAKAEPPIGPYGELWDQKVRKAGTNYIRIEMNEGHQARFTKHRLTSNVWGGHDLDFKPEEQPAPPAPSPFSEGLYVTATAYSPESNTYAPGIWRVGLDGTMSNMVDYAVHGIDVEAMNYQRGKLSFRSATKTVWTNIGRKIYAFDSSGSMVTSYELERGFYNSGTDMNTLNGGTWWQDRLYFYDRQSGEFLRMNPDDGSLDVIFPNAIPGPYSRWPSQDILTINGRFYHLTHVAAQQSHIYIWSCLPDGTDQRTEWQYIGSANAFYSIHYDGTHIYASQYTSRIHRWLLNQNGTLGPIQTFATSPYADRPQSMTSHNGFLYVTSWNNIQRWSKSSATMTNFVSGAPSDNFWYITWYDGISP